METRFELRGLHMRSDQVEILSPMVKTVSRRTAAYWPGTISADDAEQEIWVRLMELTDHKLAALVESPRAGALSALQMIGMQIASNYRNDYEVFSGNYHYSTDEVRRLLDAGALSHGDPLTATERADMTTALDRLTPQYAEALVRRYVSGVTSQDFRSTSMRAVEALTREMNRSFRQAAADHDGPALRKRR